MCCRKGYIRYDMAAVWVINQGVVLIDRMKYEYVKVSKLLILGLKKKTCLLIKCVECFMFSLYSW